MNWLTSRISEFQSFRDLHGVSTSIDRSGMRQITLPAVAEQLEANGIGTNLRQAGLGRPDSYLFSEDRETALQRISRARTRRYPERTSSPSTFTVALDNGSEAVIYLPDDDAPEEYAQFFDGPLSGPTGRIQFSGEVGERSGLFTQTRVLSPSHKCSDGPCRDWGTGCGKGCTCQKFPDAARRLGDRLRTRSSIFSARVNVSVLRCYPD